MIWGYHILLIQSNGKKEVNPRFVRRAEKNLRRKQKQLSRKTKGSANRAKARLLVAKCHEKTANARAVSNINYLEKTTLWL
ncbi:transposase [Vibrio hepatarius]|uniref:transposase n=1 Tax=Vibrio hepatarius TaxID=171383 RepID=UPI00339D648F